MSICPIRHLVLGHISQDFLVFCRLARARAALPTPWAWGTFLLTAAELLPEAFEKSDAQEKYGGENIFQAAVGGRSLRCLVHRTVQRVTVPPYNRTAV